MTSSRWRFEQSVIGLVGVALVVPGLRATVQVTLPDGPNRFSGGLT
jgi:hypothetical protein